MTLTYGALEIVGAIIIIIIWNASSPTVLVGIRRSFNVVSYDLMDMLRRLINCRIIIIIIIIYVAYL